MVSGEYHEEKFRMTFGVRTEIDGRSQLIGSRQ